MEVSYEKVKDTIDFSGSAFESNLIEVGTDTFGDKHTVFIDTLTIHEAKPNVEETLTEFVCEMVNSESCLERKYIDESWSHVGETVLEVSSEFRSIMVDCSSEYTIKVNETLTDHVKTTCDREVETSLMTVVVEESSTFELSCNTVECETVEIVDEVVPVTDVPEESEVLKVEDEYVGSEITMVDIGTIAKTTLVDISSEMVVNHVEHLSEWSKEIRHENEIFESRGIILPSSMMMSFQRGDG